MSGRYDNDQTEAHSHWASVFWRSYRELSQLIADLPDTTTRHALIPKRDADPYLTRTETRLAHVISKLAPKRTQLGDIWTTTVVTVRVARQQHDTITEIDRELALTDLASWSGDTTAINVDGNGRCASTSREIVRGYLPPHAMKALYRQLEECLEHLAWADSPAMQDYAASEDEVARHP